MIVVNLDEDDDFYIKQETGIVNESDEKETSSKMYLLDHKNRIECSQCIEIFETKERESIYHTKKLWKCTSLKKG